MLTFKLPCMTRSPTSHPTAAFPRGARYDLDKIPGPALHAKPLLGNVLELIRHDFHCTLLKWADEWGGICRYAAL